MIGNGKLNHLPFGMILNLDIGYLHPSDIPVDFLGIEYLRKNEKGQKKFQRPHRSGGKKTSQKKASQKKNLRKKASVKKKNSHEF